MNNQCKKIKEKRTKRKVFRMSASADASIERRNRRSLECNACIRKHNDSHMHHHVFNRETDIHTHTRIDNNSQSPCVSMEIEESDIR